MLIQNSLFKFPEEPKAILNEIRNFLAGRTVGITRDEALLEEVLKILFCINSLNIKKNRLDDDEVENAKLIRKEFTQIKINYPEFYDNSEEILLDPQSLSFVAEGLEKIINAKNKNDIVGDCYELFIGNSIKGQEGQFFTPHVAVKFLIDAVNPNPEWKIIDTACGASGFLSALYIKFVKTYSKNILNSFINKRLFGIEKDSYLTRLGKIHLTILSGKSVNIINGDSLSMKGENKLSLVKNGEFDLVITNPPFGAKIKSADQETLKNFDLGYKWIGIGNQYQKSTTLANNVPPQALFMERNLKALKPGGILATVIPESLVSNKNYKHVVQYILNNSKILGIFGMPESLFKTSGRGGTHTKTCLLVTKKKLATQSNEKNNKYKFFLAEAQWCGHDSRANIIPKNDLPKILEKYLTYLKNKTVNSDSMGYLVNIDEVEDNILAPRYYDIDFQKLKNLMKDKYKLVTIKELIESNVLEINTGDEVGKLAYGEGNIPYVRTSDISNWEIKIDVKQKVSEETYKKLSKKQDIQEGDLLMVKDGTYLIGTVALVTKLDLKIVYQSHIYKIRVQKNRLGITPHILLGLLTSEFVQRQIKSKQLTQDIIDSLGKRIYDLLIPLPLDVTLLKKIDYRVRSTIDLREESKLKALESMNFTNSLFSSQ